MTKFIRIPALASLFYGACACAASTCAASTFAASTFAASTFAASTFAASTIAPGTYLLEGEAVPNRQPDGNSIILEAPQ
ncbi:MAG: hypothetical protein WBF89_18010, partial [Steroidobacteraceae bacterium]